MSKLEGVRVVEIPKFRAEIFLPVKLKGKE
jgi:hypothetical protein